MADDTVRAVPRRGHLGSLSLSQILIAEGALLAVIAAATQGVIPALVTAVLAAGLLAAAFARRQNRWWLEHHALTRDHRRRRAARRQAGEGPILAALRTIAPGLTITDIAGRNPHEETGIARDEAGWFGVVALDPQAAVPLEALVSTMTATGQPGVILELVTHTVPAPSTDLPPASPAGASYRQLLGSAPIPSHRESSISVRLDAKALAESVLDHTADLNSAAALTAALTRKTATALRRLGIPGRVLDAEELLELLARSCDVEPASLADGPGVDEGWTHWRSGRLVHRTYWLETWPNSVTEIGPLFAWAATAPAAQTTVALILDPKGDDVAVRAFIRLATRPDTDLDALDRVLLEGVRRAGGELRPLDGEQGPATYATAPTGGGAG
ncbi:type VII secretion protein EccE [Actinoplanes lutulentus]|uniref:Type VII secretion protein EccE n=1 Tax=Actinoplanes lutulentus TaxID=1287878 RepID=A0A327ZF10_9ACTN|nr:type VII secretion protein EccE [Actinoplanes lutulentus]MBB2941766.1 type VII secretion protein EccE [Actinoplanes lutulentus]RAK39686.1 type VII secretion protein EccE [Actinoplanes lutulentus]